MVEIVLAAVVEIAESDVEFDEIEISVVAY
jgi:hypothetical protein